MTRPGRHGPGGPPRGPVPRRGVRAAPGPGHVGPRGRHSPRPLAVRRTAVLVVTASCLVVAAVTLAGLVFRSPGARSPRPGAAPKIGHTSPTRQLQATAAARAPSRHRDRLARAAASYISTRTGAVLAAVYDTATGQTWHLGRGRPQAEASIVKLDILETLLVQRGGSRTGLSAADQALAQQMIEDSDNAAATSLWDAVGGAADIRAFNASAGLAETTPSSCVQCPGFPWPGWGLTTTTPTDRLSLLRDLVEPNALLTSGERSYALSLMQNVTPSQRWGISGGVPRQASVALKNGWLPLNSTSTDWQINSIGSISGRGRDYLMAVLTSGNPTEQYGIDTIDGLAAMVWKGMR